MPPSGSHGYRRARGAAWVMPWPLALVIVALLHAGSLWLLGGLRLNNAPEVYYRADSPAVQLRDALRRDFPNDEVLTVVFQGPDLYGRDTLQRIDTLARALERDPLVDRVTTVMSLERISGSEDGFAVEPLVDPASLAATTREATRERVLSDRFAPGALASRDGTTLAMAVRPRPLTESAERLRLKLAVASAIAEAGLGAYYAGDAGPISVDVAQLMSMIDDTKAFVPLTAALALGLLAWVVGRLRPVLIGAVAMSTVILPVLAGVAAAGQPYTMASAILPSLLAAYTIATLVHLYGGVQRAHAMRMSRRESVLSAVRETRRPGAYNVLTTGAGLLSLMLVPIPPVQVFGIGGAAGTLLVFLTVYFLVPPFLLRGERRRWPVHGSTMGWMGRAASRLAVWSMRRPRAVLAGTALLVLIGVPLAAQVEVESDVLTFFAPSHPINVHTRIIETKLAGVTSLELSLRTDAPGLLQRAQTLHALRDLQDWLEALPEVDRASSMADLVEEMHWAMNGERDGFRTLPDDDRLVAQYLFIYDGGDLYELVDRDFRHARMLLALNVHGAAQIGRTIERIRERVQQQPLPGVTVEVGGYGRLFADQVDLLVTGQTRSFAGAFAQIFVLMALLWRSFTSSAVCMLPNVAPLFFIFVLMGASGIHLDLATVMIAGVILGITVDDTIHLFHGYRERLRRGLSPAMAIARAYRSAGRAVVATTVLLTAQFALLATSDFIPTANFGLMTAVGLFAGQAGELFLLPALLALLHARHSGATWRELFAHPRGKATESREPFAGDTARWQATQLIERPAAPPDALRTAEPAAVAVALPEPMLVQFQVCNGPACSAAGAPAIVRALRGILGPAAGDAGGTGAATAKVARLVETSCQGACEAAPVVQRADSGVRWLHATPSQILACALDEPLAGTEGPACCPPATHSGEPRGLGQGRDIQPQHETLGSTHPNAGVRPDAVP